MSSVSNVVHIFGGMNTTTPSPTYLEMVSMASACSHIGGRPFFEVLEELQAIFAASESNV